MTNDHSATVIPFGDAALRAPRNLVHLSAPRPRFSDNRRAVDNVVVLADFPRRRARVKHYILAPHPGGEAA
jgi:hypothetical protein